MRHLHPVEKFLAEQPEQPQHPDLPTHLVSDELAQVVAAFLKEVYDETVELFPHLQGKSWQEVKDFLSTAEAHEAYDKKYGAGHTRLDDDEWWS